MTQQATADVLTVLYVEDEDDYKNQLVSRLSSRLNISTINVGLFNTEPNKGETTEQFQKWLQAQIVGSHKIDGVILDSDLSGYGNGMSKETLLAVFRNMGIPVCRYSKRTKGTTSELLKHYAKLASEGAASILVPSELMNGAKAEYSSESDELIAWLEAAFKGFYDIHKSYRQLVKTPGFQLSPPALLAQILGFPEMELDLLGYTGANLFFFGDRWSDMEDVDADGEAKSQTSELSHNSATKLGYWLYNYIISFPGPILNLAAAAALLGVNSETLDPQQFANAMVPEQYVGPFGACQPLFLRQKLEALLIESGTSGVEVLDSRKVIAEPIYKDDPNTSGVYCIATNASIKAEDGVGPIDFIPGGASDLCRISRKTYQRWMPWLNL
jgi:hypothetical protein